MAWLITISEENGAGQTKSPYRVEVEDGLPVDVVNCDGGDPGMCSAIPCVKPARLVFVFRRCTSVRLDGQPLWCPMAVLGPRGGRLSVRRGRRLIALAVTHQPRLPKPMDKAGVCLLCHDPFGRGQGVTCPGCGRAFHTECAGLVAGLCLLCQPQRRRRN
jgi:hypothetical protein